MAKNSMKPRIRFKGFTDAWEQRKLGEMGETYAGLSSKSKEDFGHGEAEFVPYMNVFTNPIADVAMTEAIEIDDRQAKVKNGDVLFTTSSETPEEVGMSSVWLKNGSNTYLNSFCFGFRASESINSYYLAYMLRSSGVRRKIVFLAQGISRYNISKKKMMEIKVPMPISAEQRQLGEIFRQLDNLITLHQRKYDKIVNIKKALLEKMFPAEGEEVPKIRFKGFTEAWEQCELGKIANEVTRTDPESTAPIMMITANNGFIEQSDRYAFDNAGESLKKYILLEKGELAYNHGASKLRPYGSCFALTTVEKARIPFVYHCFSAKNYNSEFLSIELNGENVEKQLRRIVSSGARMDGLLNISFTEYSTITLSLPKRKEQDKISLFLIKIDNLITLHQRKVEKLKNIKSALLEKMFV